MATPNPARHTYDYPRPALTVDCVLVSRDVRPHVLLIQRQKDPFQGMWALPGGFVDEGETLLAAARRELAEETGLTIPDLEQLYAAGDPGRDPRGWTVSVVFLARIDSSSMVQPLAGDDAAAVQWFPLDQLPSLAFDHGVLLERARIRIQDRRA